MNRPRWDRLRPRHILAVALAWHLGALAAAPAARAQQTGQTGTISGRVVDEHGAGVSGAQVFLVTPAIATTAAPSGSYTLTKVPPGTQTLHVRMLGFRPDSASVNVTADLTTPRRTSRFSATRCSCRRWS